MRSLAEHLQLVVSRVRPLEPLALPLLDANGCVLAMDVNAPANIPAFHSSTRVGYAARSGDIAMASPDAVLALRELPVGSALAPGCLIRMNSADPLPYGADCVLPLENTDQGSPVVRVGKPVHRGENIALAGSQVKAGTTMVSLGQVLGAREIALLAALGIGKVPAYPRPRVAVITTGSELVDAGRLRGRPTSPDLKPDINGVSLACSVVELGALSYRVGPVADDPAVLRKILDDQLGRADMVVTTGGIGAAADDVLRPVLATMGTVDFAWVALEPGRVQGTGSLGTSNVPLIALPGEPVAAFVGFELFVGPVVRRLMGHADVFGARRQVELSETLTVDPAVTTMVPVSIEGDVATPVGPGVRALIKADALASIAPGGRGHQRGDVVTAVLLAAS
jgi:molybdopterin molybdotransferase